MKILTSIIKIVGIFAFIFIMLLTVALVLATLTDYRPPGSENLPKNGTAQFSKLSKNELTFVTWNIGYGGLGKEMDFFYEGGKQIRPDIGLFNQYMKGIGTFIEANNHTDFILLQEVDKKAKRSNAKNQVDFLSQFFNNYDYVFAKNYDVPFVPVPIKHPMGGVLSGIVSFTVCSPITSERVSFPGDMGWPNSLFLLDRCCLIQRFITVNDKVLVVINTHNSAYDNGEKRKQQLDLLKSTALKEYQNGSYVLIGGDWNLNPPDFDVIQFKNGDKASINSVGSIKSDLFPENWTWAYDDKTPTNRQVDTPYKKGVTPTTILDYFLLSPNIELLEVNTIDLQFEHSDHNPVKINIRLK